MSTGQNKPQVVDGPNVATDTIVSATQQGITDAQATTTTKAVNQSGVKLSTGGVELGMGFFEACYASFNNLLSYQPLALILFLIAFLHYSIGILGVEGQSPFELMHKQVNTTHGTAKNVAAKSLLAFFLLLLNFMKTYQDVFAVLAAFSYPYFCKPSKRNAFIAATLSVYVLVSGTSNAGILALSTCFFLMAELRSPQHKAIVVIIAIITCIIGQSMMTALATAK